MIKKTQIITLLSCFGNFFTSVNNRRVSMYLEEYNLIGEEQAGFRSGYSTLDDIFSIKCIIDIYLSKNKGLFSAFIDYRKAFDNIWRIGLWRKLLQHSING